VTLFVPVVVNVAAKVAAPDAATPVVRFAAVPTTGAVPRVVPAELKVIVPVGPTPELPVLTVAAKAIGEFTEALGMGVIATEVLAIVMEMASAAEVLEV
jgi:hypothetical protein